MTVLTRAAPSLRTPGDLCELLGIAFTDEQLAAITAPLEPAVIVAGAGSGKTTVMAARVVWLVGSGQVAPGAVLGLTFTNKAAGELAGRIRVSLAKAGITVDSRVGAGELAGPAVDDEPTVSTYHAFAQRLLADHGLRIGVEPRSRLLADATRFQLAYRTLCRAPGPFTHLTKPVRMLVAELVALDGELNEHLVSTDELRAHDEALLAEVDSGADIHSGADSDVAGGAARPKLPRDVATAAEVARRRLELTELVDAYREAKRSRDMVDFGDQMALAAQLAEQRPEVGSLERDRFRVVLLDEYQDTSVAQRRMLASLFGSGHPVTAVGDPCQAIYGWRGASVANLDEFPRHFAVSDSRPADRYTLRENRRSGGNLLRLANTVASPLRSLHTVEPLQPSLGQEDAGTTTCAVLPTHAEEVDWVATQVEAALAGGTAPAEVAVLVRTRADFPALYAAMTSRGVPVEVVGLGGLLTLPEVADVVATLEVLEDPTANAALVRLLTGPRWRIGPRDLVLLGRRARQLVQLPVEQSDTGEQPDAALEEAVAGVDPTEVVALADALESPGRGLAYSAEARQRFARLAAELRELRRHLGEPLLDVLHRVVGTIGLDVELAASPSAVAAGRSESLASFLDHAAAFADLDGDVSAGAFLAFLRAAEEYERGLDTTAPSTGDSVKLLTAHRAKGLEWDVVLVPNVTAKVFPTAQGRPKWTTQAQVLPYGLRGDAADLPDVGEWTAAGLKEFGQACRVQAEHEERRLAYVAFTRPRTRLVVSGQWWGPTQKTPRGPSDFLHEVRRVCETGYGAVDVWAEAPATGEANPQLDRRESYLFPHPLDADALAHRRGAADAVLAALDAVAAAGSGEPEPGSCEPEPGGGGTALSAAEAATVASWDSDAETLVAELRRSRRTRHRVQVPTGLSASQLVRMAADPAGFARDLARPMPRRPTPHARRGTRFHAWVEAQSGQRPLLGPEDLRAAEDDDDRFAADEAEMSALKEAFRSSPYADRVPVAVETPFQLVLGSQVLRGRIDAVYADGDGYEVVDWKTGDTEADPLQLAVYALAWAEIAEVPVERVSAVFFHVGSGRTVRPSPLPDRDQLLRLLAGPDG